eukprot:1972229-Rhodomonas_salina.1
MLARRNIATLPLGRGTQHTGCGNGDQAHLVSVIVFGRGQRTRERAICACRHTLWLYYHCLHTNQLSDRDTPAVGADTWPYIQDHNVPVPWAQQACGCGCVRIRPAWQEVGLKRVWERVEDF